MSSLILVVELIVCLGQRKVRAFDLSNVVEAAVNEGPAEVGRAPTVDGRRICRGVRFAHSDRRWAHPPESDSLIALALLEKQTHGLALLLKPVPNRPLLLSR